eukprot:PhF_6_TR22342/c0_g1_i1/m.31634/K01889/FARSA, pheS; phenylalanyl-tRNA synthetase alpha chain
MAEESGVVKNILQYLNANGTIANSIDYAAANRLDHQEFVGAIKSLECDEYVTSQVTTSTTWVLTEEGNSVLRNGSPECIVALHLQTAGEVPMSALETQFGKETMGIAMSNGMKQKLLKSRKEGTAVFVSSPPEAKGKPDEARDLCDRVQKGQAVDPKDLDGLKKRKLVQQEQLKIFQVTKGPKFALERVKQLPDITREMITSGSWKTSSFKPYNLNANGRPPLAGALHPLMKVRQEYREIFLELGFSEMETANFVESSFWNFDTLFVPQKHPARDMQDTFFLAEPALAPQSPPEDYVRRVKAAHENGGDTGSTGYHYDWSEHESRRNVLRTHTTAVSSWVLYNLAQKYPLDPVTGRRHFVPGKYFSIDRVFRNEEMDKTHLCEFHQIEGFVVDRDLSLANMKHILHQFFTKIGIHKLRFKPAYNPYTEPSMEIFGYHDGHKKWVEVGNSGVFRPEMLRPMGFDDGVTAIAWGLSLERPTMIKYGIQNIHELFGHKVDLGFIRKGKICWI